MYFDFNWNLSRPNYIQFLYNAEPTMSHWSGVYSVKLSFSGYVHLELPKMETLSINALE